MFFPVVVQALNGGCYSDNCGEIDQNVLLTKDKITITDQKTVQVGRTNFMNHYTDNN